MKVSLKSVSTILFFAGFLCAILLITHKTFGFDAVLKIGFYVGGGLGLILNLYLARPGQPDCGSRVGSREAVPAVVLEGWSPNKRLARSSSAVRRTPPISDNTTYANIFTRRAMLA